MQRKQIMRIHSENSGPFIQALATSINKDPVSLEYWRILHIERAKNSTKSGREALLKQLQDTHHDVECDAIHCPDNDIVLITRSLRHEQLHAIAREFTTAEFIRREDEASYALYDLFRDWRCVAELLTEKVMIGAKNMKITADLEEGGTLSLENFSDTFIEAKKLRKRRAPLHVMLVEDEPLTRRLVCGAFKEHYSMSTAIDAKEAIANYLLLAPDIVFLDIGLPDASGFDVLRQMIAIDPDAYIVMFSGNGDLENVLRALSYGACGFVAKPLKKERMRHYIQDSALHHHKHSM